MIEIEPEPSAHKENSEVNSAIDFGLNDGHKEVTCCFMLIKTRFSVNGLFLVNGLLIKTRFLVNGFASLFSKEFYLGEDSPEISS